MSSCQRGVGRCPSSVAAVLVLLANRLDDIEWREHDTCDASSSSEGSDQGLTRGRHGLEDSSRELGVRVAAAHARELLLETDHGIEMVLIVVRFSAAHVEQLHAVLIVQSQQRLQTTA